MINPNQPDFDLTPANPARVNYTPQLADWKDTPVLSIVTPFYNVGAEFYETAKSILCQSLQEWEWLIINDGSTDQTALSILAEYRHHDPRIHVIDHPENRGLSAARNTGISHARSEYIVFLDSDDLLEPTAAEKWWWYLETHPQHGFAASYHVAFGSTNFLWTGGFQDGVMNTERNRVSMMCTVRKSVFNGTGLFDESIHGGLEDWEFWMRSASKGLWGGNIPEYLAWYRVRGDHSDRWANLQEARLNEFHAMLKDKYPELYAGGFPNPTETVDYDLTQVNLEIPAVNRLQKTTPQLLIILPWLVMGGAERFTLNLIDQLIERGWKISVVSTAQSDNPWLHEFEKRTPDVFILPNFLPIKDYPRFLGYLIQSRDFDAVMVQGTQEGYRLTPFIRSMYPHIPIMDFLHFVTPEWMQGGFPRLSRLYDDCIDFTFTSCEQVRQWMIESGATPNRVAVCYIGVDPKLWKPNPASSLRVRTDLGIDQGDLVLLYAARLEEQKQPDVFLRALRKLREQGDQFHALVAGEGTLLGVLKAQLESFGLQGWVHFLGSVPTERMPSIMAASDIFFLPSQNEGISQAVYEAMACGLVVVSADVGGQAEVVTPECGVLILPQEGVDEATRYTDVLHELGADTTRRQEMSRASRERIVERFTVQQMGECIHNYLNGLIEVKQGETGEAATAEDKKSIQRGARTLVEYLQVRERLKRIEPEYSELVKPKTASYWFYLWIRQLFLPLFQRLQGTKSLRWITSLQTAVKNRLVKTP